MNETSLGYKGIVQIKLRIKDKIVDLTIKNNGTDYFKKAFCKFLTGNYGGSSDIPQMLDLRRKVEEASVEKWTTCLNQEIILSGKTYLLTTDSSLGINNNWVARFNAAIPYSALLDPISDDDTGEYRFYLYGSFDNKDVEERYHDLAYIDIDAQSLSNITEGTQALLEWSMQLLNVDEISEGE